MGVKKKVIRLLYFNFLQMYITGSKAIQQKLWDKATEVIKCANKQDIGKKELVKTLLEIGVNYAFVRIILMILLAISVIGNILQFIF